MKKSKIGTKEVKGITERIIEDLSENKGLNEIIPKLQILSFKLKNPQFTEWVEKETKGTYSSSKELPRYRISRCSVHADLGNITGLLQNFNIPVDQIPDPEVRGMVETIHFFEGISKIEDMALAQKDLKKNLPAFSFPFLNQTLGDGWQIIEAWQIISTFTFKHIVDRFKSALLDFILKLDEELDIGIDLGKTISDKEINRIVNTTINAGVVTTGSDTNLTIESSNIIGGKNNQFSISNETRKEINALIDSIERKVSIFGASQEDVRDEILRIKAQLKKENPRRSILKTSFTTLKEIFNETVAVGTAPFIIEGIQKVIKLIS